ncbi:Uncharacterised protein [Vibrio cholerae]|nr:Uncharacterised protein [Vibrio cholerae]
MNFFYLLFLLASELPLLLALSDLSWFGAEWLILVIPLLTPHYWVWRSVFYSTSICIWHYWSAVWGWRPF